MSRITSKWPVLIGTVITALSLLLLIVALVVSLFVSPIDEAVGGVSRSFALWTYSVILAMISLFFYAIDGVICLIKAVQEKEDRILNIILTILIIGSIPMVIYVGGGLGISILIWNVYYIGMYILEIVSIKRHVSY